MAACRRLRSLRRLLRAASHVPGSWFFLLKNTGRQNVEKPGSRRSTGQGPKPRRCMEFGPFRCQITQTDFGGTTVTEAAMAERLCGRGFGRFTSQKPATCSHYGSGQMTGTVITFQRANPGCFFFKRRSREQPNSPALKGVVSCDDKPSKNQVLVLCLER